ncbi:UNVERIFIED_ORG: small neutral amino acid transporter SnatA (MarC family) [Rhizobium esperanzae]
MPLIAGPGAISATILLAGTLPTSVEKAQLIAVIAANLLLTFLMLLIAERLDRFLGVTGQAILTRLLGVILAALAVQFVVDGAKAALNLISATPH